MNAPHLAPCVHHWLIESPHGPKVAAVCKRCGATREYAAASDDTRWEGGPRPSTAGGWSRGLA